jgi:hypothetical protein
VVAPGPGGVRRGQGVLGQKARGKQDQEGEKRRDASGQGTLPGLGGMMGR